MTVQSKSVLLGADFVFPLSQEVTNSINPRPGNNCHAEMEYCVSAASMLAEEIWQIAEGFVEVPVNLLVQLKKCGKNIPND